MSQILLSEGEKTFVLHGVQENFRVDGRQQCDYRLMELETDIVSNTNGSARLRLATTDVVVGIKAELEAPLSETPDEGKIEFFMDCSAIATPEFEGRGGENLALEVCSTLKRAYQNSNCLDLKSLCVIPKEQCWTIYVDILVCKISGSVLQCGGNLFDTVSLAVKSALYSTKISNVTVTVDENGQTELELSDDPFDVRRLNVLETPCLITLTKIGNSFVVDPSLEEEACSVSSLVVGVSQDGKIYVTKKIGSGSLHPESVLEAIETASQVGISLNKQLFDKLKEEETVCVKMDRKGFL